MSKKLLLTLGTITSVIAPIASVISCGKTKKVDNRINVAYVAGFDGFIDDRFNGPIDGAIHDVVDDMGAKMASLELDPTTTKEEGQKQLESLVTRGAQIIVSAGTFSAQFILEQAIAHPKVLFLGAAISEHLVIAKGGSDADNIDENRRLYKETKNVGTVNSRSQDQGFVQGYLAAMKHFTANEADGKSITAPVKFTTVGSKPYLDTSAIMDGYIAGVQAYAKDNSRFVDLVSPMADGSFFTNVPLDAKDNAFTTKNKEVVARLKEKGVKMIFPADMNMLSIYNGNHFELASDYDGWSEYLGDINVVTRRNWNAIMNAAISNSLENKVSFRRMYHDQTHLASFENGELLIHDSERFKISAENTKAAMDALKVWTDGLAHNVLYSTVDEHLMETSLGTCKGFFWLPDLI